MRFERLFLGAALVALAVLPACSLPSGFTSRDRAVIESEAKFWADAVVAGDAEAIASCYETEGVILPGDGSPIVGTEALTAYYAQLPDIRKVRLQMVELNGHGPLAYALGTVEFVERVAEGEEPRSSFRRFVDLWRRQSNGRWLIARALSHELDPTNAFELEDALNAGAKAAEEDGASPGDEAADPAELEPAPADGQTVPSDPR
ncbi:hypothetical protein Pla163_01720 [Planctomycetes bacterium Pla163]|uniref:DUF4440 domain-containing protein n=1 Tax=Rohdeia mirabilis TaxID=2528008 RepID=A0A518CV20_9BACT|nr:hypothetical protein Pla163_01720 [Planctomycetes bacterium Pla163]